jgi:hypothetical protein
MKLGETYSAAELQPSQSFDLLPAGWYTCIITDAEVKDTKAGNGQYIKIRYDITGPSSQGRCVFGNLNIKNPNPKAEEIGRQQLGDIMRALGLVAVNDTDQLINGHLSIKIDVRPGSGDYGPQNEVKGWKSNTGSMPPQPGKPDAPAGAPATKASPPWATKR